MDPAQKPAGTSFFIAIRDEIREYSISNNERRVFQETIGRQLLTRQPLFYKGNYLQSYFWGLYAVTKNPAYLVRPPVQIGSKVEVDRFVEKVDRLLLGFYNDTKSREALDGAAEGKLNFLSEQERNAIIKAEGLQGQEKARVLAEMSGKTIQDKLAPAPPPPKAAEPTPAKPQTPKTVQKQAEKQEEEEQQKNDQPENAETEQRNQPQPRIKPEDVQKIAKTAPRSSFFRRQPQASQSKPRAAVAKQPQSGFGRRDFFRRIMGSGGVINQVASSPRVRGGATQVGIGVQNVTRRAPGFLGGFLGNTGKQLFGIPMGIFGGTGSGGAGGGGRTGSGIPRRIAGGSGSGGGFGNFGRGFGRIAKGGGKKWLLILLIFLIAGVVFFGLFNSASVECGKGGEVELQKTGPTEVANGKLIDYQILVNFKGGCTADLTVTDQIPANTKFVKADSSYKILGGFDTMNVGSEGKLSGNIVTWALKAMTTGQTASLTLSVEPTKEDIWVSNEASYNSRSQKEGTSSGSLVSGACPSQEEINNNKRSPEACQYLKPAIDIFDTSFSSQQMETYVKNYASRFVNSGLGDENEFRRRINYIASSSQAVGLNPVIFLGYWKSESAFGTIRNAATFGCAPGYGVKSFEEELNCAVGLSGDGSRKAEAGSFSAKCASPNNPQRENACNLLKEIRAKNPDKYANIPVSFPIQTLDDFAETYGSRAPNLEGAAVNNNCVNTYNILLEVASELNACKADRGVTIFTPTGSPTKCSGNPISFGVAKKFLPLPSENSCSTTSTEACGRPGTCVVPKKIVLHTTISPKSAEGIYEYFASGAQNRGVGSHFVIGKGGETIQMVETLEDSVEVAYAVANYSDHISIEMTHTGVYNSKAEVPTEQYKATLSLVEQLMEKYNIPLGSLEYTWVSSTSGNTEAATPGVYGHYQLNPPPDRTDPGAGLMRDLRADLVKDLI